MPGGRIGVRVIGLTGGIASGKSLVATRLGELGAELIDADRVGWETYKQGTETYRAVIKAFGEDVVGPDGEIDRKALGAKVFGDAGQRRRLEAIVWPAIRRLTAEKLDEMRARGVDVAVVEAAVLIEASWQDLCDEVWLVVADPETAISRMMSRNGLAREAAQSRLAAQLSNDERRTHANVVIENDGSMNELMGGVDRAWSELQERIEVRA
jgi:phosphopantetheine adenylyltransferase/dephospho-CoA kinase